MITIIFIGAMLVLMWALLIQPQRRRQQKPVSYTHLTLPTTPYV